MIINLCQSHCSYDNQSVSESASIFHQPISSCVYYTMTNSKCVIPYLVITLHLIVWTTGCEWNCTLCSTQSIKSHLMANRESVMLLAHHLFHSGSTNVLQDVSVATFLSTAWWPYLFSQQIECEWSCTFAVKQYLIPWGRGLVLLLCWTGLSQPIPWLTASKSLDHSFYSQTVIVLHNQQQVSNKTVFYVQ